MNAFPYPLPLILDGAADAMLSGMPQDACPELWVLEHPDAAAAVQAAYAAAGSRVLLAPTGGANRAGLRAFGLEDRVGELCRGLVALSRRAAAGSGALVAGGLSPDGLPAGACGEAAFDELYDVYFEQASALAGAGVDLFFLEGFTALSEARAAALAVRDAGDRPFFVSFTCGSDGRTPAGTDFLAALTVFEGMGAAAFGADCGEGPEAMLPVLARLSRSAHIPLLARPSAGALDPEMFAAWAPGFLRSGIPILGGGRGTTPDHIRALSGAVRACGFRPAGARDAEEPLIAATEKDAHFLDPTADVGETIVCSPELAEDLLDAEADGRSVIRLSLESEEDLARFVEDQYLITKPLCLVSDDERILESALRAFNGRAVWDGARTLPDEVLRRLESRYGLILL